MRSGSHRTEINRFWTIHRSEHVSERSNVYGQSTHKAIRLYRNAQQSPVDISNGPFLCGQHCSHISVQHLHERGSVAQRPLPYPHEHATLHRTELLVQFI